MSSSTKRPSSFSPGFLALDYCPRLNHGIRFSVVGRFISRKIKPTTRRPVALRKYRGGDQYTKVKSRIVMSFVRKLNEKRYFKHTIKIKLQWKLSRVNLHTSLHIDTNTHTHSRKDRFYGGVHRESVI